MLVLVTVTDEEAAAGLVDRLEREVVAAEIRFQEDRRRVCIELKAEPERNLGRVLRVVEEWLGEDGRKPTKVEIDGHDYTLGARL
jgi:hypothetical protein